MVLSQRFARRTEARPFDIYRALRTVAPTPYMYYLHADDVHIAGASVETLVRVTGRDIYYHPIAGTRRRGHDEAEDLALEAELARRRERARRAHYAGGPRPQRRGARLGGRQRARERV